MWIQYRRNTGLVVVLSGPSGVGKDSVLNEFLHLCPDVNKCVTYTTRSQRQGETDTQDYNFVSVARFQEMIVAGELLEWATVHGNLYGTPRTCVDEIVNAGGDIVLKIDVQGGIAVKKQISDAVMIFLAPPSVDELKRRLIGRLTERDEEVMRRLKNAEEELRYIPKYEYLIVNDTIRQAAEELRSIVIAERHRIQRAV
jgi:guanylate kinase